MFSDEMLKLLRVLLTTLQMIREQLRKENVSHEKIIKTLYTISPILSWAMSKIEIEEKERRYLEKKTNSALQQAQKK